VILVKDETKVKSCISWEGSIDALVDFCESNKRHSCVSLFKPIIDNGNCRYESIVDSFRLNKKGSFANVTMVDPLHDKLSRIVFHHHGKKLITPLIAL